LYGRVVLPQAVFDEMRRESAPEQVRAWLNHRPAWLEVRSVQTPDPTLKLGAGEREAIALAQELQADLILLDDRKARRAAEARGLTGTLAVLATAARRGLVDLPTAIARLQRTTFRAPADLIQALLAQEARKSEGEE
jgi:predicted nucleic acid-binding protein